MTRTSDQKAQSTLDHWTSAHIPVRMSFSATRATLTGHAAFQRCAVAMAGVMAEVIDRAFSCTAPSTSIHAVHSYQLAHAATIAYSTILELDNLLTKTEHESVPLAFKNPSITDMIEKPYLKDQYVAYQIRGFDLVKPPMAMLNSPLQRRAGCGRSCIGHICCARCRKRRSQITTPALALLQSCYRNA